MSIGNCPETPRQKMIGMMYLFLTAMLAVNVSSTVLDSFDYVDRSLRNNNDIFRKNNTSAYDKIKSEHDKNEIKFETAYQTSLEIREKADSLYQKIEEAKWLLARKADGEDGDPYNLKRKDNVDVGAATMTFRANPTEPSRADVLKKHVEDYRTFLTQEVIGDNERFSGLAESIGNSLKTNNIERPEHSYDSGPLSWEANLFEEKPLAAIIPMLTKLQSDVLYTEAMSLSHVFSEVTASEFKVNDIRAHLIPEKTYLVRGSKFKVEALLAAVDTTKRPKYEVLVNGRPLDNGKDGVFEISANATGRFEITGNITTEDEYGNPNIQSFDPVSFEVAEPSATVSATKMNVLYAGVDNPMSISVPGFSARDIKPRLSDGSPLTPRGSAYIARPRTPNRNINVIVNAVVEGKTTVVGQYPFRVKSLPPPTAFVQYPKENAGGSTTRENFASGRIRKRDLLNAYGIVAELLDSDFDVTYNVIGFDMTFYDTMGNARTFSSSGSKFTTDQVNRIKSLARGKQFFISNIKAKGPDGVERRLPPIDVTIS